MPQHNPDSNSQPSPSDIPADKGDYASDLKGGLPMRRRRYSPFDKIGARLFSDQPGKMPESYTGK